MYTNRRIIDLFILKRGKSLYGLAFIFSIFLSSCGITEAVYMEHRPSEMFYKTYNASLSELTPFWRDSILFTIDVNRSGYDNFVIWLGLYSEHENKYVSINKATMFNGHEWREVDLHNKIILAKNISTERIPQESIGSIMLFEPNNDYLLGVGEDRNDSLILKVFYEIDNEKGEIEFKLNRREEKQIIYPT